MKNSATTTVEGKPPMTPPTFVRSFSVSVVSRVIQALPTTKVPRNGKISHEKKRKMVRRPGFEPGLTAWKAAVFAIGPPQRIRKSGVAFLVLLNFAPPFHPSRTWKKRHCRRKTAKHFNNRPFRMADWGG